MYRGHRTTLIIMGPGLGPHLSKMIMRLHITLKCYSLLLSEEEITLIGITNSMCGVMTTVQFLQILIRLLQPLQTLRTTQIQQLLQIRQHLEIKQRLRHLLTPHVLLRALQVQTHQARHGFQPLSKY